MSKQDKATRIILDKDVNPYNYARILDAYLENSHLVVQFGNGTKYLVDTQILKTIFVYPNVKTVGADLIPVGFDNWIPLPKYVPRLSELQFTQTQLDFEFVEVDTRIDLLTNSDYLLSLNARQILEICEPRYELYPAQELSCNPHLGTVNLGHSRCVFDYSGVAYTKAMDFKRVSVDEIGCARITMHMGDTYFLSQNLLGWLGRVTSSNGVVEYLRSQNQQETDPQGVKIIGASIYKDKDWVRIYLENYPKKYIRFTPEAILMLCDERFKLHWSRVDINSDAGAHFLHCALWNFFLDEVLCFPHNLNLPAIE